MRFLAWSATNWLRGHVGALCQLIVGGVWLVEGALKLPEPAEDARAAYS